MSEQAVKDTPSSGNSILMRAWQANVTRPGDKVINFSPATSESASSSEGGASVLPPRDWVSAIDLVQEAAEAIRISEERAVDLENQLRNVISQAEDEVRQLQKTIASNQLLLAQAEDRARRAETRAKEAETWLVRIHDAVFTAFGSKTKTSTAEPGDSGQDMP
ncbi:TolC family protein [Methylobacterium sp. R2-1]|uniref:TolC family protein n=1 Tax=Methylobacterium sp. R2-1 TaxID=2587064 RepID=UPI00161A862E|nr:TolC family protein [Methylobacterium sp. R2-1]MBB2963793.1 chromosome segregation ATPase [Methylobacterium sp. R2-1]